MAPTLVTKAKKAAERPKAKRRPSATTKFSKSLKPSLKQREKKPASLLSRTLQLSTLEPEASEDENDSNSNGDGEVVHLYGFSSDEDSSDEESDLGGEPVGLDIGKLPTVSKDDETVKRRLEKAKRQPTEDRGVLYIGRLPHGFYEDQLRGYFSQFGTVTRLRVSRNKKTGKPKHYAFIEFDSSAVAKIVAETMDNYLLMGHILQCKVIPKDEVHPELWVGANRKWRLIPQHKVVEMQHNKDRTDDQQKRVTNRLLRRQRQRKRKLAELGIDYDIDAVGYKKMKSVAV